MYTNNTIKSIDGYMIAKRLIQILIETKKHNIIKSINGFDIIILSRYFKSNPFCSKSTESDKVDTVTITSKIEKVL